LGAENWPKAGAHAGVAVHRRMLRRQPTYGQCRQPESQHVPRAARKAAVKTASPLPGPAGNVEYFVWLRRGAPPLLEDDLRHAIETGPND